MFIHKNKQLTLLWRFFFFFIIVGRRRYRTTYRFRRELETKPHAHKPVWAAGHVRLQELQERAVVKGSDGCEWVRTFCPSNPGPTAQVSRQASVFVFIIPLMNIIQAGSLWYYQRANCGNRKCREFARRKGIRNVLSLRLLRIG